MKNNVLKNSIMLYGLSIAKIIFPLLTLPYLTRVLSTESYGVVAYVKTTMQYMQIVVDFGFMLSGTKDIVAVQSDKTETGRVTGEVLGARILLALLAFLTLVLMIAFVPILRANRFYTLLSFITVFLSIFLFDYLFRGLEKMQVITLRFIIMRGTSTVLTFVFVRGNDDILWIPVLDIIGSLISVVLVAIEVRKLDIKIVRPSLRSSIKKLLESAVYFASNMATTAFGALNTLLIGIFLPTSDVAYWSVSMQLIGAVQTMYNPITEGIYPEMVKSKDFDLIKQVLKIFMPIIVLGCVFAIAIAKYILVIVGGAQYAAATTIFRLLVPVLLFSFPGMVLGWPTLGAIGRAKEVTISTFTTAAVQVLGLILLGLTGYFTLISLAVLRTITESMLCGLRLSFVIKYRGEFMTKNGDEL